jgi:hypothetical protein
MNAPAQENSSAGRYPAGTVLRNLHTGELVTVQSANERGFVIPSNRRPRSRRDHPKPQTWPWATIGLDWERHG